jgi:hypothetical protein
MGGFEAAGRDGKKWLLQCAFVRAHRERTLPRGAVAGGRRGAVNVPATSTSTTIQPVVVTLPLSVCTVRVRASAMGIDRHRLKKDRRRRGRATPFVSVSVRLTPDEREPRLERRCPACPT